MKASARIVVAKTSDGGSRAVTLRSDGPLQLRADGDTVYVVGGGAAPVGGDDLHLEIVVKTGATLHLRGVAAMLAQPGPTGSPSSFTVIIRLDEKATLDWRPMPTVSIEGSDHTSFVDVSLAESARLLLYENIQFGRWGEPSGTVTSGLRVSRNGVVLLHNSTCLGAGSVELEWPNVIRSLQTTVGSVDLFEREVWSDLEQDVCTEPQFGDLSTVCVRVELLTVCVAVVKGQLL